MRPSVPIWRLCLSRRRPGVRGPRSPAERVRCSSLLNPRAPKCSDEREKSLGQPGMLVELLHNDYGLGIEPVALEDRSPVQLHIVNHTGTFHDLQDLVSEEAVPYRRGMDPIQTRQRGPAQSA